MARSGEPPQGVLVVWTYGELDQFVEAFAEGLLNLLLIIGRPGVQKSRAGPPFGRCPAAVGGRACWIDGSATAFGLYGQLYRQRDRPVVIDDVDGLYADRAAAQGPLPDRAAQTPGLAFRGHLSVRPGDSDLI